MREHVRSPAHRPEVIQGAGWEGMRWEQWPQAWSFTEIDTSGSTVARGGGRRRGVGARRSQPALPRHRLSAMEPWLERAAAVWPDRLAVETADGALTYAELRRRARGLAASPGDRVAILLPPGLDFAVALHACLLVGAVAMPVDLRLSERERDAQLREAGLVIDAPLAGAAGGSTHMPDAARPVPRRPHVGHDGLAAAGHALVRQRAGQRARLFRALGHDRAERWLCPLPLSHVGGLMVLLRSVIAGTTAVLDAAERADVTIASLVPTQLARLLEAGSPPPARCAS